MCHPLALEHALQFERKREVEVDQKKSKCHSDNIDQIDMKMRNLCKINQLLRNLDEN